MVSLTSQLQAFFAGDREAAEAVLRVILPKLREIAVRHLAKERYVAPVSPTELINEVWLRQIHKGGWSVRSREHFYAIAGCAIRRVLVEFARNRLALKRGALESPRSLSAFAVEPADTQRAEKVLEIGLLIEKLGREQPGCSRVFDLHYFAGFSFPEIAKIMGLNPRQVRHLWVKGRNWLKSRISSR